MARRLFAPLIVTLVYGIVVGPVDKFLGDRVPDGPLLIVAILIVLVMAAASARYRPMPFPTEADDIRFLAIGLGRTIGLSARASVLMAGQKDLLGHLQAMDDPEQDRYFRELERQYGQGTSTIRRCGAEAVVTATCHITRHNAYPLLYTEVEE